MSEQLPLNGANENGTDDVIVAGSESEERKRRGQWANRAEFLLAIVGYTVGIGSVWRFPMMCAKNGGGAFLIPFFFFLFTCGGPLYYLEVCLGQFSGKSAFAAFEFCPLFKGLGALMVLISFVVLWYIMILLAWVFYYMVYSFFPTIPWSTCDNWWNTPQCEADLPIASTGNDIHTTLLKNVSSNDTRGLHSSSYEFWQYNVLRRSPGLEKMGTVHWQVLLCLFVSCFIIVLSVIKGVKSLGKVVYVTATLPYLLLTIIFIRGLTLDGAVDGIIYFVTPDFAKIANAEVWLSAAVQVFYSLGPTWGGVITMASYNKFHQRSVWETTFCVVTDGVSAFYCGLVVFTVIGFMAKDTGLSVAELSTVSGPGLAFIAYPTALSRMPLPQLWSVLFFIMMVTVAFDSFFGMFETITSAVVDAFPRQLTSRRALVNIVTGIAMFLLCIPFTMNGGIYLFQLADWYSSAFALIFGAAFECVMIGWIYGADRFCQDICLMTGRNVSVFLRVVWVLFIPAVLLVCFCTMLSNYSQPDYGDGYEYPAYAIALGFIMGFLPIIVFLAVGVWEVFKTKGNILERLSILLKPSSRWGPSDSSAAAVYKARPYRPSPTFIKQVYVNIRGGKDTPFI